MPEEDKQGLKQHQKNYFSSKKINLFFIMYNEKDE